MFSNVFIIFVLTLASLSEGNKKPPPKPQPPPSCRPPKPTPCRDLKPKPFNYTDLISGSPFTFTHTSAPLFDCSVVYFVGPKDGRTDYTGSSIIQKGSYVHSYDYNITNGTFQSVRCDTGVRANYQGAYLRFDFPNALLVAVLCNKDNDEKYDQFLAVGRTENDTKFVDDFINDNNLKDAINIKPAQANCTGPKYCAVYTS